MWLEGTNALLKWSLEAKLARSGKSICIWIHKSSFDRRVRIQRQHRLEFNVHFGWASWRNWRAAGRMAFVIIFDVFDALHGTAIASSRRGTIASPDCSYVWTNIEPPESRRHFALPITFFRTNESDEELNKCTNAKFSRKLRSSSTKQLWGMQRTVWDETGLKRLEHS